MRKLFGTKAYSDVRTTLIFRLVGVAQADRKNWEFNTAAGFNLWDKALKHHNVKMETQCFSKEENLRRATART